MQRSLRFISSQRHVHKWGWGQAQVDISRWGKLGSAPCGHPHRKLDPSDVILSSCLCISTVCGRPQWEGEDRWTIISLPKSLPLFHMLVGSCAHIFARNGPHLQKLHRNPWNIHATKDTYAS